MITHLFQELVEPVEYVKLNETTGPNLSANRVFQLFYTS